MSPDESPHAPLQAKERWEFDAAGKLEQARLYKEKGTNYFKAGKFQLAEKNYKRCVEFLEFESGKWVGWGSVGYGGGVVCGLVFSSGLLGSSAMHIVHLRYLLTGDGEIPLLRYTVVVSIGTRKIGVPKKCADRFGNRSVSPKHSDTSVRLSSKVCFV